MPDFKRLLAIALMLLSPWALALAPIPTVMTPIERFENLEDWPYVTQYVDVAPYQLQMAYVDEGPADGEIVLLMHGNPGWGYEFRDMIQPLVNAGYRVIVPDLIGFGQSEKPVQREEQTYINQVSWVSSFMDALDLQSINLFCQDWGGLITLRIAGSQPERFNTILAANTALPDGTNVGTDVFLLWRNFISEIVPNFSIIMQSATVTELTPGELAAYDAPFPPGKRRFQAGPRQLPKEVPVAGNDNFPNDTINITAREGLAQFNQPFLTIFALDDLITTNADLDLQQLVPGAQGQPHQRVIAGHYIQDDQGPLLAEAMIQLIQQAQ